MSTQTDAAPVETAPEVSLRQPTVDDGILIHRLIAESPPLDTNSVYCNLLQCSYFARHCVLAEAGGQPGGFISAFLKPDDDQTLFVWQVVVAARMRGQRLAMRMLQALLQRECHRQVRFIETTISPGNRASEGLFHKLAAHLGTSVQTRDLYLRERHFHNEHDTEVLYRLGPFEAAT